MSIRYAFMICLLAVAGAAHGQSSLQLDFNDDAARLGFTNQLDTDGVGGLAADGSFLHNKDNGEVGALGLHVTGDAGSRTVPVTATIGGRAYWVNLDNSNLDAGAIGVGGRIRITLPDYNRLGFSVNVHYAPEVLSFADAESFIEYGAEFSYQILRQAEIFVGYREIEVDYDVADDVEIDDGGIVGLRILF